MGRKDKQPFGNTTPVGAGTGGRAIRILYGLLVFIPISFALAYFDADPVWVFASAALAIVPLAGFIGKATEEMAKRVGPLGGSLLNATFSNATELIIAVFALRAGLVELVKASIVGTIVGNILLVLGASTLAGGLRHKVQHFNRQVAGTNASMLLLAVIALLIPTVFHHGVPRLDGPEVPPLSLGVAITLLISYGLYLVFSLGTHRVFLNLTRRGEHEAKPVWSVPVSLGVLVGAAVLIGVASELLVGSVEAVVDRIGVTQLFIGFIIIPLVGNAAEHGVSVVMALRNRMDLALGVAVTSSTQVALLLAPVLILVSRILDQNLTFVFNLLEVTALAAAVTIANLIAIDGESNWFEGVQLLAAFFIIALAFFYV